MISELAVHVYSMISYVCFILYLTTFVVDGLRISTGRIFMTIDRISFFSRPPSSSFVHSVKLNNSSNEKQKDFDHFFLSEKGKVKI